MRQPVTLERHRLRKIFFGDGDIKCRVIAGGIGVMRAAQPGDGAVIFAFGIIFCAGEQQMLNKMREAAFAMRVICPAGAHKQRMHHGRNPVIRHHHDANPIAQTELLNRHGLLDIIAAFA